MYYLIKNNFLKCKVNNIGGKESAKPVKVITKVEEILQQRNIYLSSFEPNRDCITRGNILSLWL